MKHHEDKESDGEEVNSQDNRNSQLDLTDGEKEEREKIDNRPHTPSSSDDNQSVDEATVHHEDVPLTIEVGGGVDIVDQELKPVDQSNNEPQNVEIDVEPVYNDVELNEDNSTSMEVDFIKESGDKYLEKSSPVEKIAVSEEGEEVNPIISSNEADAILVEEKSDPVGENDYVAEVDKVASSTSVKIEDVTVPRVTGNGEKEVIILERNLVPTVPVDSGSEKDADKHIALSALPLTEENLMLSKNVTISDVTNSDEQKNDIEVSESSIRQPLLAARPQPRTSWMNCCGLFELFAGSSR